MIAKRGEPHGTGLGVLRYVVERTIAWLHGFRRLRIRWERRDDIHEAFLSLAFCLITHRHVQRLSGDLFYAGAVTPKAGQETELRADAVRNRARILRIARERLAAGDTSLQLNAIARLAGVGVGTVYRHFPNRHALVEALSAERFRELIAEAQAAVAADDPRAGLHRLLRFALDRMLDDSDFAAVLESAADASAQTSDMRAELDQAVTGLLDRARLSGAIRDGVDAEDVRRLLCGVHHAVHTGGGARRNLYLDVLLEGLRPPR